MEPWIAESMKAGAEELLKSEDLDAAIEDFIKDFDDGMQSFQGMIRNLSSDDCSDDYRALCAAVLTSGFLNAMTKYHVTFHPELTVFVKDALAAIKDEKWHICFLPICFTLSDGDYDATFTVEWFLEEMAEMRIPDMSERTKQTLSMCGYWPGLPEILGVKQKPKQKKAQIERIPVFQFDGEIPMMFHSWKEDAGKRMG